MSNSFQIPQFDKQDYEKKTLWLASHEDIDKTFLSEFIRENLFHLRYDLVTGLWQQGCFIQRFDLLCPICIPNYDNYLVPPLHYFLGGFQSMRAFSWARTWHPDYPKALHLVDRQEDNVWHQLAFQIAHAQSSQENAEYKQNIVKEVLEALIKDYPKGILEKNSTGMNAVDNFEHHILYPSQSNREVLALLQKHYLDIKLSVKGASTHVHKI